MALFGIKRIQYCKATQLAFSGQNNPFLGIASEPTNTFTDVVCMINSRATLTIEQAVVKKQKVYTAKLQFVTPADPMLDVDHYAFIASTNEGERILLGANTRPQVAVVTAQGVFGNAGELTAYTTTAEFKADYRPLRLPVTAAEPISGPAYDICCGQIPQPTAPDTREFDICCGQIQGEVPPPPNLIFTVKVRRTTADAPGIFVGVDSYVYDNAMQPTHRAVTLTLPVLYEQNITFTMFSTPQPYASDQRAYYLYFAIADPSSASFYNYQVVDSDFSQIMAMFPAAAPIYNSDNIQVGFSLPGYPPAN